MKSKDEKWALFWCKLLHPIIFGEIEREQTNQFLKDICLQDIVFPNGKRKRPSISTLRRKLNQYRKDGFQSLARKARIDRGTSRKFSREIIDKAVELKKNNLAVATIPSTGFSRNTIRRRSPNPRFIATSNSRAQPSSSSASHNKKVRIRWTRDHTHDLWLGDFQEGPYVLVDGEVLPANLCLFIDCHSRYVVEGRYYLKQTLDIVIDSLIRAWTIHGSPKELYLDNAKAYISDALRSACYGIGIKLRHRPPHDPRSRWPGRTFLQHKPNSVRSGNPPRRRHHP